MTEIRSVGEERNLFGKRFRENGNMIFVPRKKGAALLDDDGLRLGKWLPEEEAYADTLIEYFDKGLLKDCNDGDTLRAYISKKLQCNPMRVSKKYAGKCIGKHAFVKSEGSEESDTILKIYESNFKEALSNSFSFPYLYPTQDQPSFFLGGRESDCAEGTDCLACKDTLLRADSEGGDVLSSDSDGELSFQRDLVFDSDFEFTASMTDEDFKNAVDILHE